MRGRRRRRRDKNMIESGALFHDRNRYHHRPLPLVSAIIAFYHFLLRVYFFFVKPLKSGVSDGFRKADKTPRPIRTIKLEFI